MTVEELLPRLDTVRRSSRGYMARCPAHQDKSPSLSIGEGADRILLHCFALCEKRDIVAALGLTMADLFSHKPATYGHRPTPKPIRIDRVALSFRFGLAALDRRLRAERIITAGKVLDVSSLSDAELDRALNAIAQADADIARAKIFEYVADTLQERDFTERKSHEQRTCAA